MRTILVDLIALDDRCPIHEPSPNDDGSPQIDWCPECGGAIDRDGFCVECGYDTDED